MEDAKRKHFITAMSEISAVVRRIEDHLQKPIHETIVVCDLDRSDLSTAEEQQVVIEKIRLANSENEVLIIHSSSIRNIQEHPAVWEALKEFCLIVDRYDGIMKIED